MRESEYKGPEARLGITWAEPEPGKLRWNQPVGEQMLDPEGRFATGSLALLVDSGLGSVNHRRRPAGMWTVWLSPPRSGISIESPSAAVVKLIGTRVASVVPSRSNTA